jgi:predicted PhzF superfamily epimerase YddE/YHI9
MEVPVTPALVGGCLTHLHGRGTVETATTVVEQGHFCDRPGRVHVDATSGLRVGGRTVTTLEGTVTLPPAEDDDIHVA